MADLCPDCGHEVGWDQMRGECPRPMQNYQNEQCKERQVEWLKSQLTAQSAALTQALERAERAERQSLAWEMLATATALTTGKARFFRQKDQSAAEWNSTLVIADTYGECAVNLATKLGLLDSASQGKP